MAKRPELLWKIEHSDYASVSYLFGTMHVKDIKAFRYEELVCSKIDECSAFATEINLEQAEHTLGDSAMLLPEGQSLSDLYTDKNFQKISHFFFDTTNIHIEYFENNQPLMLVNVLSASILGQEKQYSLDEYLWRYAGEQDKIMLGIETVQEQLEVMSKIPLDYQTRMLLKAAKNKSTFRRKLLKMTAVYQEGDLGRILKSAKKSAGSLRKILLYNRNQIMAERIGNLAKEQSIVCAVGAGHLGGKKGVLRLLKGRGFKVKNIPLK